MKKICIMLLLNSLFVHTLGSQTLIQQVESAYNSLDTITYIKDLQISYQQYLIQESKETEKLLLELSGLSYEDCDSIQKKHKNSIAFSQIEERSNQFSDRIRAKTPVYVLNLIPNDEQTLQVDTGKLSFNLFYFDKDYKGSLYVYCKDGQYSWQDVRYRTFSRQVGENAPKVFRKIMRKQPKYLLYCSELEGMNTILYVLNDKIYIYRIVQVQEYELSDYIKTFGISR